MSRTGAWFGAGALAFGIGTSEVEHVLATQTLLQKPAKNMRVVCNGPLPEHVTSKDLVLHIIGAIGTAGAQLPNRDCCCFFLRTHPLKAI